MSTPASRLRDPIGIACLAELEARTLAARSALIDCLVAEDASPYCDNEADLACSVHSGLETDRVIVEGAWACYIARGTDPIEALRARAAGTIADSLEVRIRTVRSPLARANGLRLRTGVIESIKRAPDFDEPRRPIECGAQRIAQHGDNHDGGATGLQVTWDGIVGPRQVTHYAGCHLDRSHLERNEPHDFSPLPDVEHVDALDMLEIEARAGVRVDTLDDGRARMRPAG